MSHYTVRNLSTSTKVFAHNVFGMLAMVSESLVFVYIGLATPRAFGRALVNFPVFTLVVIIGCLVGRAANVYSCAHLVNRYAVAAPPEFVVVCLPS